MDTTDFCQHAIKGDLSAAPADILHTLKRISTEFCMQQRAEKHRWQTIKVTSIQRLANEQAGYIKACLAKGCPIYENQQAVAEYLELGNMSSANIEKQITDQMSRNCYISKHLSNRAVDIGTAGHSRAEIVLLKQVIHNTLYEVDGKEYTAQIEDRSHGTGPHLHLNFEPYSFVPDRCPSSY